MRIRKDADIDPAFATFVTERVDAVLIPETFLFFAQRARIASLALSHRLPAIAGERSYAEAGAVLSYGAVYFRSGPADRDVRREDHRRCQACGPTGRSGVALRAGR